jgi:hypothetical protein
MTITHTTGARPEKWQIHPEKWQIHKERRCDPLEMFDDTSLRNLLCCCIRTACAPFNFRSRAYT